jgi:hypothetical protein
MAKKKFLWVFPKETPNKAILKRVFKPLSVPLMLSFFDEKDPVVPRFSHENFKASQEHIAMAKPWQKRLAENLISARYEGLGGGKVFKFVSFPGYDIEIERISHLVDWDILTEIAESEVTKELQSVKFKKDNLALKQTA